MELVVDTSAIIAVLVHGSERETILQRTVGAALTAPSSVHWEVGNAFSAMLKRRRITLSQARQAVRIYEQMQFRFIDVDIGQSLNLSDQLGLYAYDAYVLACALTLHSPLLTLDKALAGSAPLAGVRVMEVNSS